MLSLFALLIVAAGYAARRLLGTRENEWQTVGASPSPAASPSAPYDASSPVPASIAEESEPADLYDVEPDQAPGPVEPDPPSETTPEQAAPEQTASGRPGQAVTHLGDGNAQSGIE